MNLLRIVGFIKNIFKIGGNIVATHILEGEIPKIKVSGVVSIMNVVFTVSISSRISNPDIITFVGKIKNWRFCFAIKKSTTVRRIDEPMLPEYYRQVFIDICLVSSLNSN